MTAATLEQIASAALSSVETLRATYDIADMAIRRGVPGDFVECGVYAGAQCAAMALAIMERSDYQMRRQLGFQDGPGPRRVHLFDSFIGIPQAGPNDIEYLEAGHKPGLSACSLDQVRANMRRWGIDESLLVYHPGMFDVTIPRATALRTFPGDLPNTDGVHKIAVLRLDGDLYESTKVCIEHLYPLLSPGGWLIVDDFDLTGSRKALIEYLGSRFGPGYFQKQSYNWPEVK